MEVTHNGDLDAVSMERRDHLHDLRVGAVRGEVPVGLLKRCSQLVVESGQLAGEQLGRFVIRSGEVADSIRLDRFRMGFGRGERLRQLVDRSLVVWAAEPFEHSGESLLPGRVLDEGAAPIKQNGVELSISVGHARTLHSASWLAPPDNAARSPTRRASGRD